MGGSVRLHQISTHASESPCIVRHNAAQGKRFLFPSEPSVPCPQRPAGFAGPIVRMAENPSPAAYVSRDVSVIGNIPLL